MNMEGPGKPGSFFLSLMAFYDARRRKYCSCGSGNFILIPVKKKPAMHGHSGFLLKIAIPAKRLIWPEQQVNLLTKLWCSGNYGRHSYGRNEPV